MTFRKRRTKAHNSTLKLKEVESLLTLCLEASFRNSEGYNHRVSCDFSTFEASLTFALILSSRSSQMQEVSLKTLARLSMGSDWHRHRIVQVKTGLKSEE